MKNLLSIIVLGIGTVAVTYSQEITAFPSLSESYEAVYNDQEIIDDQNYALYTQDYRSELQAVDQEIDQIKIDLQKETREGILIELNNRKEKLFKKKAALLEEAELLEDLNKFY